MTLRGDGFYLLVTEFHDGNLPSPEPGANDFFASRDEIVLVGDKYDDGGLRIDTAYSEEPPDEEPDPDEWDAVRDTVVRASGPLEIRNGDFSEPAERYRPLTQDAGTWHIRIRIRSPERTQEMFGEYEEQHLIEVWPQSP
ncbi:hypothetical protein [Nocardioides speluncae]|uniref:hypothetical protein n=1 Tax=Nocardioides speluncae TaxID=2670337 RepID=UPI000D693DFD|nr:hypothetical protein [Nocardioides speluncae]